MFVDLKSSGTPFIIAEVGQNHQGQLDIALEYIKVFSFAGANAVKFQTRNNRHLFSKDAYEKSYDSENAFAGTYGKHRETLELKPEWLPILKAECLKHDVFFMSTPFEEISLQLLIEHEVDILKVASFDLGNIPFLDLLGRCGKPVVMSCGGGNDEQIRRSVETLLKHDVELALLHCVSEYPCPPERLGLSRIKKLQQDYPSVNVGLSDHFNGILSGPVAHLEGAMVFEKHVTLNRSWKGTDHAFSLTAEGFRKFVRDINRVKSMLETKPIHDIGNEPVFQKLGKSIVAKIDLDAGSELTIENLSGKIFDETFIPVRESGQFIGKSIQKSVAAGEPILREFVV